VVWGEKPCSAFVIPAQAGISSKKPQHKAAVFLLYGKYSSMVRAENGKNAGFPLESAN